MKALLQRVSRCSVVIEEQTHSRIGRGVLILLGVAATDTEEQIEKLVRKIAGLRIFEDNQGKMNLSNEEIGGEYMVVSQFTLYADTGKGKRPGFEPAMKPPESERLYEKFCARLAELSGRPVQTGHFGASMQIELVNDGPATFVLESTL